jgi:hypothetical protein
VSGEILSRSIHWLSSASTDLRFQILDHVGRVSLEKPLQNERGYLERRLCREFVCDLRVAVFLFDDPAALVSRETFSASVPEANGPELSWISSTRWTNNRMSDLLKSGGSLLRLREVERQDHSQDEPHADSVEQERGVAPLPHGRDRRVVE